MSSSKNLLKTIGPGLLFASSAIGTSHLVLSTRAGAHHGMIYFGIILLILLLKYPFYEFGPRYAAATGHSLVKGYKDQGKWAVVLFIVIIFINMFAVTGAIAAVSAGLLSTMFGVQFVPVPILAGLIIFITVIILLLGSFKGLDYLIKIISVVLLISVLIALIAVLIKGPVDAQADLLPNKILEGAGLTLLVSLIGWMPAGMEASTMNSIWTVEKIKSTNYHPTLKESRFDFNLGYVFTIILALMFMTIGAYTVYGSGTLLEGNATQFSNQLLKIFTANLGDWAFLIIALAAFGTIYGTLITVMDAFPRSLVRGLRVFKFKNLEQNEEQEKFLNRSYKISLVLVGIGGFLLFYFSAANMLKLLEGATILSFVLSPIIAFLNLRAIQSRAIPDTHKASRTMIILAYIGLVALTGFAIYYLSTLI